MNAGREFKPAVTYSGAAIHWTENGDKTLCGRDAYPMDARTSDVAYVTGHRGGASCGRCKQLASPLETEP